MDELYQMLMTKLVNRAERPQGFAALFSDAALKDMGYDDPIAAREQLVSDGETALKAALETFIEITRGQLEQQLVNRGASREEAQAQIASYDEIALNESLFMGGASATRQMLSTIAKAVPATTATPPSTQQPAATEHQTESLQETLMTNLVKQVDRPDGFAELFSDAALQDMGERDAQSARDAMIAGGEDAMETKLNDYLTTTRKQLEQQLVNRGASREEAQAQIASYNQATLNESLFMRGAAGTRRVLDEVPKAEVSSTSPREEVNTPPVQPGDDPTDPPVNNDHDGDDKIVETPPEETGTNYIPINDTARLHIADRYYEILEDGEWRTAQDGDTIDMGGQMMVMQDGELVLAPEDDVMEGISSENEIVVTADRITELPSGRKFVEVTQATAERFATLREQGVDLAELSDDEVLAQVNNHVLGEDRGEIAIRIRHGETTYVSGDFAGTNAADVPWMLDQMDFVNDGISMNEGGKTLAVKSRRGEFSLAEEFLVSYVAAEKSYPLHNSAADGMLAAASGVIVNLNPEFDEQGDLVPEHARETDPEYQLMFQPTREAVERYLPGATEEDIEQLTSKAHFVEMTSSFSKSSYEAKQTQLAERPNAPLTLDTKVRQITLIPKDDLFDYLYTNYKLDARNANLYMGAFDWDNVKTNDYLSYARDRFDAERSAPGYVDKPDSEKTEYELIREGRGIQPIPAPRTALSFSTLTTNSGDQALSTVGLDMTRHLRTPRTQIDFSAQLATGIELLEQGKTEYINPLEVSNLTPGERRSLDIGITKFYNRERGIFGTASWQASAAGDSRTLTAGHQWDGGGISPVWQAGLTLPGSYQSLGGTDYSTNLGGFLNMKKDVMLTGNEMTYGFGLNYENREQTTSDISRDVDVAGGNVQFAYRGNEMRFRSGASLKLVNPWDDNAEPIFDSNSFIGYQPEGSRLQLGANHVLHRSDNFELNQVGATFGLDGNRTSHSFSGSFTNFVIPATGFRPEVSDELVKLGYELGLNNVRSKALENSSFSLDVTLPNAKDLSVEQVGATFRKHF